MLLSLVASACEVLEVTAEATTVLDTTRHHQGYLFLWVTREAVWSFLKPPKWPFSLCILWTQLIRTEDPQGGWKKWEGHSWWQRTKETLLNLWARCYFEGVPWQEFQGGCAWYSREKTENWEEDVSVDHLAWGCGSELREPAGWITCWGLASASNMALNSLPWAGERWRTIWLFWLRRHGYLMESSSFSQGADTQAQWCRLRLTQQLRGAEKCRVSCPNGPIAAFPHYLWNMSSNLTHPIGSWLRELLHVRHSV